MKKATSGPAQALDHLRNIATEVGDKRFLAQLAGVSSLFVKRDWRGVLFGCRMLYRIADESNYLDKVEPLLRPFFNEAQQNFEKSRAAMVRLYSRLVSASRTLKQVERLSHFLKVSS